MAVFKCKMCGGTLEIAENQTTAVCEYCSTQQTLPRLIDDKRENLYDRANHFRRSNEFDKAMSIYDQILSEDGTDAEAYWSLVLCRYGIEYVEDPVTHNRVPTVNRVQFTSIYDDSNYKCAIENADAAQKTIYEAEANAINEIQKSILAISQKEEPFDVFICYKETDANGSRTQDSVLANDLYHQLTHEGFKVFFARITLEDKLGVAYEPYIFAALNSAKVMVVIGTKPEYFNAVWVKNEWSRYLALVRQSAGKKVLIPAYKGMDPYDLPEEFSHLQAQDMAKLGFMQDLVHGINKLTGKEKRTAASASGAGDGLEKLLARGNMFVQDGDFDEAVAYFNRVLDGDPENHRAYWGLMLAARECTGIDHLLSIGSPIDEDKNYQKAIKFSDGAVKTDYEQIAAKVRLMTHLKCMTLAGKMLQQIIANGEANEENEDQENEFLTAARKYAKRYEEGSSNDDPLLFVNREILNSSCYTQPTAFAVGSMIKALEVYEANRILLGDQADQTIALVKDIYAKYTQRLMKLLEKVEKGDHKEKGAEGSAILAAIDGFADPVALCDATLQISFSPESVMALDTDTVNDRYRKFITQMCPTRRRLDRLPYHLVAHCYKQAFAKDPGDERIRSEYEKFAQDFSNDSQVQKHVLEYMLRECGERWYIHWACVLRDTDELNLLIKSNLTRTDSENFVQLAEKHKNELLRDMRKIDESTRMHRERAFQLAGQSAPIVKEWEDYYKKLEASLDTAAKRVDDEIEEYRLEIMREKADQNAKEQALKAEKERLLAQQNKRRLMRKITHSILLLFTIIVTAAGAILLLRGFNEPMKLLQFNIRNFFVLAICIAAIWLIADWIFVARLIKEHKQAKFSIIKLFAVISRLASLGVLAFSVFFCIFFGARLGEVHIGSFEELKYLKNFSKGTYLLDNDIDCKENSWSGGNFKGLFNGQSHTIRNLKINDCFVKENKGYIKCVSISASCDELKKSEVGSIVFENKGDIEMCIFKMTILNEQTEKLDSFGGVTNLNMGTISNCTVTLDFQKLNTRVFGGFAAKNTGKIHNSKITVNGALATVGYGDDYEQLGVGGFVGINALGEMTNCTATGNLTCYADDSVAIGGFCGTSINELNYGTSTVNMNVTLADEGIYVGGFVGYCKKKISSCCYWGNLSVTGLNDNTNLFVGGLAGYFEGESIGNCYSTGTISTHGTADCIRLGGITSWIHSDGIYNSYSAAALSNQATGGAIYSNVRVSGVSFTSQCDSGDVMNCFFTGTMYDGMGGSCDFVEMYPRSLSNCYSSVPIDDEVAVEDAWVFGASSFIHDRLGFSDEYWLIVDGQLPTLRPMPEQQATPVA